MATTVRLRIEGRVQGVWFRGWTVQEARLLGLVGWVRNRLDGSVEAVFSGEEAAVAAMIAACYRGPNAAHVHAIERLPATEEDLRGEGFSSLPTV